MIAWAQRQESVGNADGRRERDRSARGERRRHARRPNRLDADDANRGAHALDRCADACDLAAATHRYEDRSDLRVLLQNLEARRSLAGDDPRVIERRDDREPAGFGDLFRAHLAIGGRRSCEHNFGAVSAYAVDFHARRRLGHHDHCRSLECFGHERDRLTVIAGRVGDHAGRPRFRWELRNHVARAANLEGAAGLKALALEIQAGLSSTWV